jgi:nucleoside-diphosphate-sugar epimerase
MKVAVTGANGFIGRYVITTLLDRGYKVVAIVRNSQTLITFIANPNVLIYETDIFNNEVDLYYKLGCPDILIHLAWSRLPNYKELHHFEVELPRQYIFLKSMVEQGLKSIIVSGTCFEYGKYEGELTEELITVPTNPYGLAKDTLRKQLEFLKGKIKFKLIWARLFYTYGDGQSESSLVSQLKKAIYDKKTSFNMSKGEQLRDYLPIAEIANYLCDLAVIETEINIINICSGKPISVRAFIENYLQIINSPLKLNLGYYDYPDYEALAFWGSNKKLHNLFSKNN